MALDALATRSNQEPQGTPQAARAPADDSRGIPADARKRYQILEDCRELVVGRLTQLVREALGKISEELTELALKSGRREEQQALLDAVAVVRSQRGEIEVRFRKAFVDSFERRLFSKKKSTDKAPGFEGELSLVDDSVMVDQLNVDRLVSRARGKLDPDEVLGVRARLAALLERDWFEENAHPAAPEAVFEALKTALNDLSPKPEVQTALLDAFEPHVTANLNQVYSTVNERLKASRVLPKIRPQVSVQPSGQRRGKPGTPGADAPGLAGAHQAGAAGGMTASQQGIAAAAGSLQAGAMPGGSGGDMTAVGLGDLGGMDPVSAFNLTMQQLAQGVPAARASAARILTDPESFGVADLPLPTVQPPLIDALSTVQQASAAATVISPQMLSELAERTREQGSPLDQLTVEIVSLVFDYIYADKRLADVVKQQLLRLQVVAVKAALIDRSFFARRQHPMRRLIDRISELATDPDADLAAEGSLVKGLVDIVEWILANFDRDLETFEEALDRLQVLADQEDQRRSEHIAQLTRQAERAEALANGREQARALLDDRMDLSTPEFVRQFLADWWAQAMAEAGLSEEGAPLRPADAMSIAEALIWSVEPKGAEEISRLAALLPKLIGGLMRGLKLVAMPDDKRAAFFDELLRVHTRCIESAKQAQQQAKQAIARNVSRIRMKSDGSIQFTPPRAEEKAASAARASASVSDTPTVSLAALMEADVQRGDQIELDDSNGETVRFKLSWISPSQRLFILTRFPDEARSIERGPFAALFEEGKARVVGRRSTLDRAIDQIAADSQREVQATPA